MSVIVRPSFAGATDLRPEAVQGFDRYIRLTEKRMIGEVTPGGMFLWVDSLRAPERNETMARLKRGEVVSEKMRTPDPSGNTSTPEALIHHWEGTVFIPNASLRQVLTLVQDYDHHTEYYKPEVVRSKTMDHAGNDFKVYLRLKKKKVVTVVLDTEYDVHYHSLDAAHVFSESYSTRIAEINHPDEPDERATPEGRGEGFMWRLDSYWRFAERDGGVYVQCEAISLTRDIPTGLNWLVAPFIESIPRESLEFTLLSTRSAVLRGSGHVLP
ncbi:MAG TPA: hypothetical protein VHS29_06675 [Candidatus Acidoferrales bacterium]|nr:hypothetical protein [Candidatus Acidoferrales bacterium]